MEEDQLFINKKTLEIYYPAEKIYFKDKQTLMNFSYCLKNKSIETIINSNNILLGIEPTKTINFINLFGSINLIHDSVLILVEKSKNIGQILGSHTIFKIEKLIYIPLNSKMKLNKEDQIILDNIKLILDNEKLYYSDSYDLTNNLKNIKSNHLKENNKFSFEENYFFNLKLLRNFSNDFLSLNNYFSICISGFFEKLIFDIQNIICEFCLISRREVKKMGRRFLSRGIDKEGFCSNTVETEQIFIINLEEKTKIYSFLQLRGSIPVKWNQYPTLKYNPVVNINGDNFDDSKKMEKLLNSINLKYNENYMVNLIDKKGSQLKIGSRFETVFNNLSNNNKTIKDLNYLIWFDFHQECRKMKFENTVKLLDSLKLFLNNHNYTEIICPKGSLIDNRNNEKISFIKKQTGIVRTNCMDCLDRTNVVQSVFGRYIFFKILKKSGLSNIEMESAFHKLPDKILEENFRKIWTLNADYMSILYSGTPALKTDFTRTGKRTIKGAINDGKHSVQRYFINNFKDIDIQNGYDFIQGKVNAVRLLNSKKKNGIKVLLKNSLYFLIIPNIILLNCLLFLNHKISMNYYLLFLLVSIMTCFSYFTSNKDIIFGGHIIKNL